MSQSVRSVRYRSRFGRYRNESLTDTNLGRKKGENSRGQTHIFIFPSFPFSSFCVSLLLPVDVELRLPDEDDVLPPEQEGFLPEEDGPGGRRGLLGASLVF